MLYLRFFAKIKDKSGYMIHGFGQDNKLFQLFEEYRAAEARQSHSLAVNYSDQNYFLDKQIRFFIGFDNDVPVVFSSIFRLDWWPSGAYRILNRLWKPRKNNSITKTIDPLFFKMVTAQIDWLAAQPDFKVAFVSRQGNSKKYLKYFAEQNKINGNNMNEYELPIKTCQGPDCDCLQNIVYIGDRAVLEGWPK
jgi:hypothetical protein